MAYLHVDICYPLAARNVPMVKMCLDQGVGVSERISGVSPWQTPLTKAVETAFEHTVYDTIATIITMRRDSRKIVQLLLEYGADPNQKDGSGLSAHDMAEAATEPDWLIQQLLRSDQHPYLQQFLTFMDAAWAGDLLTLKSKLAEVPRLSHQAEELGISPIGAAVFQEDAKIVEVLLQNGTSPNAIDPIKSAPLAIAVATGSKDMVRLLLRHGASLTISDPILCLTPLEYAAREGNHSMCAALLECWSAQGRRDAHTLLSKPLALAVRQYHVETARLLLDFGANIFMNMCSFLTRAELQLISSPYPAASRESLLERVAPRTPREFVEAKIKAAGSNNSPGNYLPGSFTSEELQELLKQYEQKAITSAKSLGAEPHTCEHETHEAQDLCNSPKTTSEVVDEHSYPARAIEARSLAEMEYLKKKAHILALQAEVASPSGSQQPLENGISVA